MRHSSGRRGQQRPERSSTCPPPRDRTARSHRRGTSNAISIQHRRENGGAAKPTGSSAKCHVQSPARNCDSSRPINARIRRYPGQFSGLLFAARHLQRGVNRQRQSLGLTRNVGGKRDDGPQFAETSRVADDPARTRKSWRCQGQRHVAQPVQAARAPKVRAARSRPGSTASSDNLTARTITGNVVTGTGEAGTRGGEYEADPKPVQ